MRIYCNIHVNFPLPITYLIVGEYSSILKRIRAREQGASWTKFLWIPAAVMGFFLRHILPGNHVQFTTNLDQVGRRTESASSNKTQEPDFDEYDMIIVGGGTAGCVLASRLTEDASLRVLLLESGGSGQSLVMTRIPIGYSLLFHTKHVYELHTEPQSFAQGKRKYWPRAKMLGGCSSINAQMAQYGAPGDFDQWSEITGDESWSWMNFSRYFNKFEKYVHDPEHPQVDTTVKGTGGPVRVGYFSTVSRASKDFVQACIKLGIPFSPDFNTSNGTRGVNRIMTYIDENRERVSSETAYLTEKVLARPNLKVVIHAQVTRIIFEGAGDELRASGVEFASKEDSPRYRARAKKEVIVSAGAVHSPQILLLSGVGPAQELKRHSVPIIRDLPGVGSHLVDHPVVDLCFKSKNKSNKFVKPHNLWEVFQVIGSAIQYITVKRGALVTNFGESAAFCRSDDPVLFPPEEYPAKLEDSTSAADSPDLEIFTTPFGHKEHGRYMFPVHTFSVHATLLRPLSTGTLRLKSADPWTNPLMDPRYLEAPEDVQRIMRGLKLIFKIVRAEPLAAHLDHTDRNPLLDHSTHLKTDEELEKLIRERVETLYHPAGTCRMAPLEEGGVVDSRLRVHGIRGLRVCDASIFPEIVSGHTAGAVLAVAERLSDILKEDLRVPKAQLA